MKKNISEWALLWRKFFRSWFKRFSYKQSIINFRNEARMLVVSILSKLFQKCPISSLFVQSVVIVNPNVAAVTLPSGLGNLKLFLIIWWNQKFYLLKIVTKQEVSSINIARKNQRSWMKNPKSLIKTHYLLMFCFEEVRLQMYIRLQLQEIWNEEKRTRVIFNVKFFPVTWRN